MMTTDNPAISHVEKPGRLKFSNVINTLMVLGILISGITTGSIAFRYLEDEKTADSWSILFLELERLSIKWTNKIISSSNKNVYRYVWSKDNRKIIPLTGGRLQELTLEELGIKGEEFNGYSQFKTSLWTLSGESYRGRFYKENKKKLLELTEIDTDNIFVEINQVLNDFSHFYIINRSGQLIYTGNDDITQYNYLERKLVQNFVKQSLTTTFTRYTDLESTDKFGFYRELPYTNMTLFIEIPVESILGVIWKMKVTFYLTLALIIFVSVVIVQIPLVRMNLILSSLIKGSNDIANEDYNVKIGRSSIFEFSKLALAFEEMARRLIQKDNRIKDLIVAEKEKVRLEGQVEIAGTVQELFLANTAIMKEIQKVTSSDIAHVYVPAEDASGDWFQVAYFPESDEVVYAIADVSGHGVGAAMFTAILNGLFEKYRDGCATFPVEDFVKMSGRVMYRIGKTKWACTMQVIVHSQTSNNVQMFNAGHVPAQYYKYQDAEQSKLQEKKKAGMGWKSIQLGSEPLGLSDTPEIASTQFIPESGDVLILYTDGLTEATNPKDKMYGLKRLRKVASEYGRKPSHNLVNALLKSCDEFRDGTPPGDDICIISIRFKSST
ncbi:MAG: SpoIIE family protein phosphatase [Zetaproteobacteria bacterium]|nr:SpoIIE family protein phosphatase [Zetaproteobacteria bacterium]